MGVLDVLVKEQRGVVLSLLCNSRQCYGSNIQQEGGTAQVLKR